MPQTHPIPTHCRFQDLTGRSFGRLTVQSYAGPEPGHHLWNCVCSCGQAFLARSNNLLNGHTASCGCIRREGLHVIHRGSKTPEWITYAGMKQRCHNPKHSAYALYGGRGIFVCDRWRESFVNFLADMGPKPSPSHSLDRIDNDKGYSPENCRWATWEQQHANKSTTCLLTVNGETRMMSEWARLKSIPTSTLSSRIKRGWTHERAVLTPIGKDRKNTRYLTHAGRTQGLIEWAKELGMNSETLRTRLRTMSPSDAISLPIRPYERRG